jgi:hypothetical protein
MSLPLHEWKQNPLQGERILVGGVSPATARCQARERHVAEYDLAVLWQEMIQRRRR